MDTENAKLVGLSHGNPGHRRFSLGGTRVDGLFLERLIKRDEISR